jgi:hypothetical protein
LRFVPCKVFHYPVLAVTLFFLFPICGICSPSPPETDSLNFYGKTMLSREPYFKRKMASERFQYLLEKSLRREGSFYYSWDSLKTVAVLAPSDGKFRMFNWEMNSEDGLPQYYARVQMADGTLIALNDISGSQSRSERQILEKGKWWGAHYYKIVRKEYRKKVHYLLLGANFSDPARRKKVIDILVISKQGEMKFGQPLLENDKGTVNRVIFEYRPDVSMSLRFDESKDRVIFDHLSAPDPSLTGQTQYYAPDLSYDAYYWKKGRWRLRENIDARNKK